MDKGHLNNYIFKMKGAAKEAIRRTYQKLKKNRAKLDVLSEKVKNEKRLNKIKNQIERSKKEEELIKLLSPDEITKLALVLLNCDNLLNCDELSLEEKIKIRIANCDVVQKMIKKFRQDFPGSEQWIDVTIDLIDNKRIIKSYKNKELVKQLDKQLKQRRNILEHCKSPQEISKSKPDEAFCERSSAETSEDSSSREEDKDQLTDSDESADTDLVVNKKSNQISCAQDENEEYMNLEQRRNILEHCKGSEDESTFKRKLTEAFCERSSTDASEDSSSNEDDNEQLTDSDHESNETEFVVNKNSNQITCLQDENEDYMKRQLIKAFGEELANKTVNDVSSDEEWVDDFFIDKKVKKFKPTIVDLERYKDLEEKEQKNLNS